jgi:hypothetical protein
MFRFNESTSICLASAITTRSHEVSFGSGECSELGSLEELWYDKAKQAFVGREKDDILWGAWRSVVYLCSKAQARVMLAELTSSEIDEKRFIHQGKLCRIDRYTVRTGLRIELQFYSHNRAKVLSLDSELANSLLLAVKSKVWEKIE